MLLMTNWRDNFKPEMLLSFDILSFADLPSHVDWQVDEERSYQIEYVGHGLLIAKCIDILQKNFAMCISKCKKANAVY